MREETERRILAVLVRNPGVFLSTAEIAKRSKTNWYQASAWLAKNKKKLRSVHTPTRVYYSLRDA